MDGVLVISEPARFKMLQAIFIKRGIELTSHHEKSFLGRTTKDILLSLLKKAEHAEEVLDEYIQEKHNNLVSYLQPVSVTVSVLRQSKHTFVLASNSKRKSIDMTLKALGVTEKFRDIISQDDVTHPKPNPEIYLKAVEKLGKEAKDCFAVEDTRIGAEAALGAGVNCYILLNGYNTKEEFVDLGVKGFLETEEELREIIDRV